MTHSSRCSNFVSLQLLTVKLRMDHGCFHRLVENHYFQSKNRLLPCSYFEAMGAVARANREAITNFDRNIRATKNYSREYKAGERLDCVK